ncbi:ABC transporter permease [Anaerococcus sp. AGMB00486]|uniref:ABC transporter permease n=1 Tax=Anaerococcus faecalis TaxID=2742993 RepID=A0ABX2NC70_9FIRM|nr:ABC transporter permease [Anaerococcus faecalis]NVF12057.1 ABC transporter permease [Anaerococcus faecalis]
MIRYLRYELKRSSGFLLLEIFLSLLSASFIGLMAKSDNLGVNDRQLAILILIIAQGIIILAISLIYFASRFKRDIFDKSSYITFTINISVGKVLMAKFLASLIVAFISIFTYIFWLLFSSFILSIKEITIAFTVGRISTFSFVLGLYYSMAYLLLVLGLSLSRVKIFKRYYNFVTIVLAIVLFSLIIWIFRNIYVLSPVCLNLRNFSLENLIHINGVDISMVYMGLDGKILGINVRTSLLSLLIITISFFINEYLIEERIDF